MKILILLDSFKGSISAADAGKALQEGMTGAYPGWQVKYMPIADGGENTVDAIEYSLDMKRRNLNVNDPIGRKIMASYSVSGDGQTAIIEMAQASGLTLLSQYERNPMKTSTYGTGEMIRDAVSSGCRRIIITVGGSATNDGGIGCLAALGARITDAEGKDAFWGAENLSLITDIDAAPVWELTEGIEFVVACDVTNPLLGPNGATCIFSAQKGADEKMRHQMEKGMENYACLCRRILGSDFSSAKGAGAGGGIGFALLGFLKGRFAGGFELISEMTGLEQFIRESDMIITGEGRMDRQTLMGKAPFGVLRLAQKYEKKVTGVCGTKGDGWEELITAGFDRIVSLSELCGSEKYSFENPAKILKEPEYWKQICFAL